MAFRFEERTVRRNRCADCGREYDHVTSFLLKDGNAYAIYYAACHGHPEHEASVDVVLGTWGEDAVDDHATFSCRIRAEGAALVDSTVAVKGEAPFFGRKLTREQGLRHPRLPDLWAVVDAIVLLDSSVSACVHGNR